MRNLNICFVASEVVPFAKTGGLADVSGALPKYVAQYGCEIRVFMPLYSSIDRARYGLHPVDFLQGLELKMGDASISYSVQTARIPDSNVDVYFIDCPSLYNRGSIYTNDADEYMRF